MNPNDCIYTEDIKIIKSDVSQIKTALIGNEYIPDGLINDHIRLKKRVKAINRKIIFYVSIATGFIMGLSWVLIKFKIL